MPNNARPRRSVLYMPGSNTRALEKAKTLPADGLILDLEDAVAPDAKEKARQQVCQAVKEGGYGMRELVIRTNGLSTPWGYQDIALRPELTDDTGSLVDGPFALHRLPHGGHFVHEEYPEDVNPLLMDFLTA